MGESGSGKSTSMRNFDVNEVGIFNVASKPLPFRKKLNKLNNASYPQIIKSLKDPKLKRYIIDDSQYLMAFEMFDRAKETGYTKFTDVALNIRNLIQFIVTGTPDDVIVYFLHHAEQTDTGKIKAKTSGKMIDSQLTLEGLFSIVLMACTDGQRHWIETQSNGFNTCKSPMDMFQFEIDNDLKFIDTEIRNIMNLKVRKINNEETSRF
jgi:hypothetical protein